MKIHKLSLSLVLVVITQALASPKEVIKLGDEVDYVGTAVHALEDAQMPPGMGHSTGSTAGEHALTFWGYYTRRVDSANFAMIPPSLTYRLIEALKRDGWKVSGSPLEPKDAIDPTLFALTAKKDAKSLEFLIVIFPASDGTLRVSYSQRMEKEGEQARPDNAG